MVINHYIVFCSGNTQIFLLKLVSSKSISQIATGLCQTLNNIDMSQVQSIYELAIKIVNTISNHISDKIYVLTNPISYDNMPQYWITDHRHNNEFTIKIKENAKEIFNGFVKDLNVFIKTP